MKIKIISGPEKDNKNNRFNLQVCSVSERADSESDIHFHNELVSPNVHLCLYSVRKEKLFPISWSGKPQYDTNRKVWRWGANYFGQTVPSNKCHHGFRQKYRQSWNLKQIQLVAIVKRHQALKTAIASTVYTYERISLA